MSNNCMKLEEFNYDKIKMKPKIFIVGYGSIINTESRLSVGGKDIGNAIPVEILENAGLERVWNFQKPNVASLTALGLQKTQNSKIIINENEKYISGKGSRINGVLYPVYDNIESFDKREEGYYRLRLKTNQLNALSWQNLPNYECKIYVYALNKKEQLQRPTYKYPILQSYLDVVINGCLEYGIEFAIKFIKTTKGWSEWWLNDRINPRRPWVHENNYKKIDKLLKEYVPNNYFHKLPTEYAYYKFKTN